MTGTDHSTYLLRETWFWAGVFRDHASFLHDNFAPGQEEVIRWSLQFRDLFDVLEQEAEATAQAAGIEGPAGSYALTGLPRTETAVRNSDDSAKAAALAGRLLEALGPLRTFKQQLLQRQLDCKVKLHLPPSLIQHMINEANEAFRALGPSRTLEPPALEALHLHLVWLADASGHAAALGSGLDPTERQLDQLTRNFKQVFDGMYVKAEELQNMLRIAPRMVAALRALNRDARTQINAFRVFLAELREHLEGCEILGTLMPVFADHMLREELYYMEKLLVLESV